MRQLVKQRLWSRRGDRSTCSRDLTDLRSGRGESGAAAPIPKRRLIAKRSVRARVFEYGGVPPPCHSDVACKGRPIRYEPLLSEYLTSWRGYYGKTRAGIIDGVWKLYRPLSLLLLFCGFFQQERSRSRHAVSQSCFARRPLHRFGLHTLGCGEADARPELRRHNRKATLLPNRFTSRAVRTVSNGHCGDRIEQCVRARRRGWHHYLAAQRKPAGTVRPISIARQVRSHGHHRHADCRSRFTGALFGRDDHTRRWVDQKTSYLSLNVDTGDINPGWPVDVEATATYNGLHLRSEIQQQRPALGIVGNILYVGYGSMRDWSLYHGWLVGVPIDNPASVTAWAAATNAGTHGGAIWGVGGIASDGNNPFVTTGNTFDTGGDWGGGEAVIRFQPGPIFSGDPGDYWAPLNWEILIIAIPIWVAPVHCWWTCRAPCPPILSSQWAKMATHICLIGTTSVGSLTQSTIHMSRTDHPGGRHLSYQPGHIRCFSCQLRHAFYFPDYRNQSASDHERMEQSAERCGLAIRYIYRRHE